MFGLFRSNKEIQEAYEVLLGHLTDEWSMKGEYAAAFLHAYRSSIGGLYREISKRYDQLASNNSGELALLAEAAGGKDEALDHVVVLQACRAYKGDLRSGTHVGTKIEVAIWSILSNRSDVVAKIDGSLARYIKKVHNERFPNLLQEVFRDARPFGIPDDGRSAATSSRPFCVPSAVQGKKEQLPGST